MSILQGMQFGLDLAIMMQQIKFILQGMRFVRDLANAIKATRDKSRPFCRVCILDLNRNNLPVKEVLWETLKTNNETDVRIEIEQSIVTFETYLLHFEHTE